MRFGTMALVGAMFIAAPSFAKTQSKAVNDDDSPLFDTLGWFDASIPNGVSQWGFQFDEPQSAGNLSIWHVSEPGCRGFDVNEIRVKGAADDAEWMTLDVNVFDGVAHFNATGDFNELQMTFSNARLLRANCRVVIQKANFVVPQVIELLAKVEAPNCLPDDGDGDNAGDSEQICSYAVSRLDLPARDLLTISERDYKRFDLQSGAFYRLNGYNQEQDDGSMLFVLTSAVRVM